MRVRRQGEAVCRNEYEAVLNRVSVVSVGNTTMSARWRYDYGATFMASVHSASQREVLNYLPKSLQEKTKQGLHDIWMADCRGETERALDHFEQRFNAKYPQTVECLSKNRDAMLTLYDFPAEHWMHIRTTKSH